MAIVEVNNGQATNRILDRLLAIEVNAVCTAGLPGISIDKIRSQR